MRIDGVNVTVNDVPDITEAEIRRYVALAKEHTVTPLTKLSITGAGDSCVRLDFEARAKFERIRRITGYLVGTIDRWNNAKRAEESQRVKHL